MNGELKFNYMIIITLYMTNANALNQKQFIEVSWKLIELWNDFSFWFNSMSINTTQDSSTASMATSWFVGRRLSVVGGICNISNLLRSLRWKITIASYRHQTKSTSISPIPELNSKRNKTFIQFLNKNYLISKFRFGSCTLIIKRNPAKVFEMDGDCRQLWAQEFCVCFFFWFELN